MAGRGPAPKPKDLRVNRVKPKRGEWQILPAEPFKGTRPPLPKVTGGLLAATKNTWEIWWSSPMAHMWTRAEWPTLIRLIVMVDRVTRALNRGEFFTGFASMNTEIRQIQDHLGLSEKGRRDLRWQLPTDDDTEPELAVVSDISSRRRADLRKK